MSATSVTFDVFRGTAGQIAPDQVTRELKQNEVYIEVTHSGICGTDMNFLHSGKVLGHEGVGIVRQLGPGVTSAKVGDRVGFGYTRKVCGHCAFCLAGMSSLGPLEIIHKCRTEDEQCHSDL
jgi:D-arabinose 1-dehydrogenase-like Zn-dependent alcohol dehydrogenase